MGSPRVARVCLIDSRRVCRKRFVKFPVQGASIGQVGNTGVRFVPATDVQAPHGALCLHVLCLARTVGDGTSTAVLSPCERLKTTNGGLETTMIERDPASKEL